MNAAITDFKDGLSLWRVWFKLASRELLNSVKRTVLGPIWLIVHRIFFALAFSLFGAVLWGTKAGLNIDVLIGFMVFSTMIGYLQSANSALISTVNLAESGLPVSVRFLKSWAREFQLSMLSGFVLLIASIATGTFGLKIIFLISALTILMSLWGLGLMFAISPAALRFRDVAQIITFASTILMFFSPIFWKIEDIKNKELANKLLEFNPIAEYIFIFRDLINLGIIDGFNLIRASIQTIIILGIGFVSFSLTRRRIPYWS